MTKSGREPRKYRWLTEGEAYTYQPKIGKGNDARRKTTCRVLTVPRAGGRPANALVEFGDGHQAVVPSGVLRRVKASE